MYANLISLVAGDYIHVDPKKLSASLVGGSGKLKDMTIKPCAFAQHNIPIVVTDGIVHSIEVELPWKSLKKNPTIVEVDGIYALCTIDGNILMESDQNPQITVDPIKETTEKPSKLLLKVINSIITNLKVNITNIHIRVELVKGDTVQAFGLILESFSINSCSMESIKNPQADTIYKKFTIENLSLYMDVNCTSMKSKSLQDFTNNMNTSIQQPHQFILEKFGLSGVLKLPVNDYAAATLDFSAPVIKIFFNSMQWQAGQKLILENQRFDRLRYFHELRPSVGFDDDSSQDDIDIAQNDLKWWRFTCNAAFKIRHGNTFNPENALFFLQNRKKYSKDYRKVLLKNKKSMAITKLEKEHDNNVTSLFKIYSKCIIEKENNEKYKEVVKEENELVELDSEQFEMRALSINVQFDSFNVCLYENDQMIMFIDISKLSAAIQTYQQNVKGAMMLQSILILDTFTEPSVEIFTLLHPTLSCMSVEFEYHPREKQFMGDFSITSPMIYTDFDFINRIRVFFTGTEDLIERNNPIKPQKKRDNTVLEIQDILTNHLDVRLNVHAKSPVITVPTQTPIKIYLGSLDILSINEATAKDINNYLTFYDKYLARLSGFSINFGEHVFCTPVCFSADINKSFVQMSEHEMMYVKTSMDQMIIQFQRQHYLAILELVEMINRSILIPMAEEATAHKKCQCKNMAMISSTSILDTLSMKLDMDFKSFQFTILDNNTSFNINSLHFLLGCLKSKLAVNVALDQLLAINNSSTLFQFGDEAQKTVECNILYEEGELYKVINVDVKSASPYFRADGKVIKDLVEFFTPPEIPKIAQIDPNATLALDTTHADELRKYNIILSDEGIKKRFEEYPLLHLNVNFGSTIIEVPFEMPIILKIDDIIITTSSCELREVENLQSYYDKFCFKLDGFSVAMNKEYLINPISLSLFFDYAFVRTKTNEWYAVGGDITTIDIRLTDEQYRGILSFAEEMEDMFKGMIPEPEKDTKDEQQETEVDQQAISDVINQYNNFHMRFGMEKTKLALIDNSKDFRHEFSLNGLYVTTKYENSLLSLESKIGTISIQANEQKLIDFGDQENSVIFNMTYRVNELTIDVTALKPWIKIDFYWILDLYKFFIPENSKIINTEVAKNMIQIEQNKSNKEITPVTNNQLKIIVKALCTNPSISAVLPGIDHKIDANIALNQASLEMIDNIINLSIENFHINVDDYTVLCPITFNHFKINIAPIVAIDYEFPAVIVKLNEQEISLIIQLVDYLSHQVKNVIDFIGGIPQVEQQQQPTEVKIKLPQFKCVLQEQTKTLFELSLSKISLAVENEDIFVSLKNIEGIDFQSSSPAKFISISQSELIEFSMKNNDMSLTIPPIDLNLTLDPIIWLTKLIISPIPTLKYEKKAHTLTKHTIDIEEKDKPAELAIEKEKIVPPSFSMKMGSLECIVPLGDNMMVLSLSSGSFKINSTSIGYSLMNLNLGIDDHNIINSFSIEPFESLIENTRIALPPIMMSLDTSSILKISPIINQVQQIVNQFIPTQSVIVAKSAEPLVPFELTVSQIELHLTEDFNDLMDLEIGNAAVFVGEEVKVSVDSVKVVDLFSGNKRELLSFNSDIFIFSLLKEKMFIKIPSDIKIVVNPEPINWVITFIPKLNIETSKDKTIQPNQQDIDLILKGEMVNLCYIDEDIKIADVDLDLSIKENQIYVKVETGEINYLTQGIGLYHSFLKTPKINLIFDNDLLEINTPKVYTEFQVSHLMKIIDNILLMINPEFDIKTPDTVPLLKYKINVDEIEGKFISRLSNFKHRYLEAKLNNVGYNSVNDGYNEFLISVGSAVVKTPQGKVVSVLEDVKLPMKFDLDDNAPDVNPKFTGKSTVPELAKDMKYLTGIEIGINLPSAKVFYDRLSFLLLCECIADTTFGIDIYLISPFIRNVKVNLMISHISVIIENIAEAIVNGFCFNMVNDDMKMVVDNYQVDSISPSEEPLRKMIKSYADKDSISLVINNHLIAINILAVNVVFDYPVVGSLITILIQCPFLSYPIIPPIPPELVSEQEINVNISRSLIGIPCNPPKAKEMLYINTNSLVNITKGKIEFSISNCMLSFASKVNGNLYQPFINEFSMNMFIIINNKQTLISLDLSPFQLKLSPFDIASFYFIYEQISKHILPNINIDTDESEKAEEENTLAFTINLAEFDISLCWANRQSYEPFIEANFDPFALIIHPGSPHNLIEFNFPPLVMYKQGTKLKDMIIEPNKMSVDLRYKGDEIGVYIKFLHNLHINISYGIVVQILDFIKNITNLIESGDIDVFVPVEYKIVNNTGWQGRLKYLDQEYFIDMNDVITMHSIYPKENIEWINQKGQYDFVLEDLIQPLSIAPGIVVQYTNKVLTLSSMLWFNNKTSTNLALLIQNEGKWKIILVLKAHTTVPFPCCTTIAQRFTIQPAANQPFTGKYNTFLVNDFQSKEMILSTKVKQRDFPLVLKLKRDYHGIYMMKIEHLVELQNSLPCELTLKFRGYDKMTLKSGESVQTYLVNVDRNYVSVSIGVEYGPFLEDPVRINLGDFVISQLRCEFHNNHNNLYIASKCTKKQSSSQYTIQFYAPAIIYNRTTFPIACVTPDYNNLTYFYSPDKEKSDKENGILFWGHGKFVVSQEQTPELNVCLTIIASTKRCDPINCLAYNKEDVTFLPQKNSDAFCAVHYTIQSVGPSSVVTIFSHVRIQNLLDVSITLTPYNTERGEMFGSGIVFEPNDDVAVAYCEPSMTYIFQMADKGNIVPLCLFSTVHTTFIYPGESKIYIDLEIVERNVDLIAIFKEAKMPQPIMISNTLNVPINVKQNEGIMPMTIQPRTTSFFAYERPFSFIENIINFEVLGSLITCNPDNLIEISEGRCKDFKYYVKTVMNRNKTKTIIVSEDPLDSVKKSNMFLKLFIPKINISLIDPDMRELALLTFNRVQFEFIMNSVLTTMNFFITGMQLDDMSPNAVFDVIMNGMAVQSRYFLEFRLSMYSNAPIFTSCDMISLDVQPMIIFCDYGFVSDVLAIVEMLQPESKTFEPPKAADTRSGISRRPFTANKLRISPIRTLISLRSNPDRPKYFPHFEPKNATMKFVFMLLPNVTNYQISLAPPVLKYVSMDIGYLTQHYLKPLTEQLLGQVTKIISHVDILQPIFRLPLRYGKIEEENALEVAASSLAKTVTVAFSIPSKFLHMLTGSDTLENDVRGINKTAGQTVASGFLALGKGVFDGITGIIADPIKESKRNSNKVKGVFLGIGKGIIGVVAKPICGVMDMGIGISSGIRKAAEDDETVFNRQRIARVANMGQIEPFDQNLASIQSAILEHVDFIDRSKEWIKFISPIAGGGWVALTSTNMIVMKESMRFYNFRDIHDVEAKGNVVIMKIRNTSYTLNCENEGIAHSIYLRIISRYYFLRVEQK